MQLELLTLGIDAHDEVALAQVFPARHLLRIRPPFLASNGHLGEHPLEEYGASKSVLNRNYTKGKSGQKIQLCMVKQI